MDESTLTYFRERANLCRAHDASEKWRDLIVQIASEDLPRLVVWVEKAQREHDQAIEAQKRAEFVCEQIRAALDGAGIEHSGRTLPERVKDLIGRWNRTSRALVDIAKRHSEEAQHA